MKVPAAIGLTFVIALAAASPADAHQGLRRRLSPTGTACRTGALGLCRRALLSGPRLVGQRTLVAPPLPAAPLLPLSLIDSRLKSGAGGRISPHDRSVAKIATVARDRLRTAAETPP